MAVSPSLIAEAIRWRRDFHACPELGYQEQETSRRVAELLASFGLQVHRGLAGTGVVATLENGPGPVIGLRADMDALPITELSDVGYKSRNPGVMHACGHDGHSAMLLATAAHLAQTRCFRGTVHFVFQPAEENLAARVKWWKRGCLRASRWMPFTRCTTGRVCRWAVAIGSGAMMASLDAFEITLTGKSCHAAMPERGADPIVAAAQLIMALQTIPSRRLSPQESTVVSITQISGGEAINVLPDKVVLRGTFRCLNNQVRERVRGLIESYVAAQPQVSDVEGKIAWYPGYPVTTNHPAEAQKVREVASALLGESAVIWNGNPSMASEDFACMLEACPGAYFWIGTDGETASKPLHNASYDFNDELIPHGVALWTTLVETLLA